MRRRLLVAALLPAALAAEVDGLRRVFSGPVGRIAPHLTLVPPANLAEERHGAFLDRIEQVAASFEPIELVLGGPATFPTTPVVYLEVHGETARLAELATRLCEGAGRARAPGRDFLAHVTLGHRLSPVRIAAALVALGPLELAWRLDAVTVLEEGGARGPRRWVPGAEVPLAAPAVTGRGGRELVFSTYRVFSRELADEVAAFGPGARAPGEPDAAARVPLVVVARAAGELVAVAAGASEGPHALLERLVVTGARRREGIGTATLSRFEAAARARGCTGVAALVSSSEAGRFLSGRGYRPSGEVAPGGDVAAFVRTL